jgi:anti-sigma factor RsiW
MSTTTKQTKVMWAAAAAVALFATMGLGIGAVATATTTTGLAYAQSENSAEVIKEYCASWVDPATGVEQSDCYEPDKQTCKEELENRVAEEGVVIIEGCKKISQSVEPNPQNAATGKNNK